ncbi:MAG: YgcG family protein, partial [Symploca sp. SIO3E6]|nr:YgcG family protein [Caldora sp. SIO3E6]
MPNISAGEPTWIVDKSEVLSRINEGKLSSKLESLAQETGDEVRMVTIRRLDYGETAASFAQALFTK